MEEFDCLEMIRSGYSIYDYHEEIYWNMVWEKKWGWKHYYHKEIWREVEEWDCGCMADEHPPTPYLYPSWEYVRTDVFEVLAFELGKYGLDKGFEYDRTYGLWMTTENGLEYCWDPDNIEKVPGVMLNRDMKIKELGI